MGTPGARRARPSCRRRPGWSTPVPALRPPCGLPVRAPPLRGGHQRRSSSTGWWPRRPGEVTWGAAEFIAAEEMGRSRGFWWSPDGRSLLAARVDNGPVATWWTSDPSAPATAPQAAPLPCRRYGRRRGQPVAHPHWPGARWGPAAGALGRRERTRTWWRCTGARAARLCCWWSSGTTRPAPCWPPTSAGGTTSVVAEGSGRGLGGLAFGRAGLDRRTAACCGRRPTPGPGASNWASEWLTPPGLQVRDVTATGRSVVFTASAEPETVEAWRWSRAGRPATWAADALRAASPAPWRRAGPGGDVPEHGLGGCAGRGQWTGLVAGPGRGQPWRRRRSCNRRSVSSGSGDRQLSVGVVLPTGHLQGAKLPVLMAPYGGPGHQQVMAASSRVARGPVVRRPGLCRRGGRRPGDARARAGL